MRWSLTPETNREKQMITTRRDIAMCLFRIAISVLFGFERLTAENGENLDDSIKLVKKLIASSDGNVIKGPW